MTTDQAGKFLKATAKSIAAALECDTVVILTQAGDDKIMQASGSEGSAAVLVLDGARQVARALAEALTKAHDDTDTE